MNSRDYYNSTDADTFYHTIWGGEDLHIGIYDSDDDSIRDASRRTVERMAGRSEALGADVHLIDLGSGYGGSTRYLVRRFGCRATDLNVSEVENERNRARNREAGFADRIEVVDGDFQNLPFPDNSFEVAWSQDAILHSTNRLRVLQEVARVLKGGSELIFTDPMAADDAPVEGLAPILDRLHLENLGSPRFYRDTLCSLGFQDQGFEDLTPQLVAHYTRVLRETEARAEELSGVVSDEYLSHMKTGLRHWIAGGREGRLVWGIFRFTK